MKKTLCLLGTIALAAIITFSMTSCPELLPDTNNDNNNNNNNNNNEPGNGNNNNNNEPTDGKLTTVDAISKYLNEQAGGATTDDLVVLSIEMNLGYMGSPTSNWQKLLEAIETAGKYVELDLYSCTMFHDNLYVFNPDYNNKTGKDKIVSIILPYEADVITDGNKNAFKHFTNLESVSGAYITLIGDNSFHNCSRLTKASFPQTTSIGQSAFRDCTSLTEINFPKARIIGDNAFNGSGIVSADFPEAITINPFAFNNCTSLTEVNFPKAQVIGNFAFNGSGLESADFPEVTVINPSAFNNCTSLAEVSFEKATIIGNDAFINCTSLRIARFHANPARTTSGNPLQPWIDETGACTNDSVIFFPNALKGCISLETLDVRNAWNVYFANSALADIGTELELYLFDDNGTKSYGHPQNDTIFSNTFQTLTIKAPVTANSQIENLYVRQSGDSDQYVIINTGIVHTMTVLGITGITVKVERLTVPY